MFLSKEFFCPNSFNLVKSFVFVCFLLRYFVCTLRRRRCCFFSFTNIFCCYLWSVELLYWLLNYWLSLLPEFNVSLSLASAVHWVNCWTNNNKQKKREREETTTTIRNSCQKNSFGRKLWHKSKLLIKRTWVLLALGQIKWIRNKINQKSTKLRTGKQTNTKFS